ncbi:N5-glutamine S-adenosyl-L-methionine-dependent methyltransferase [Fervidicella metallireducens AeB]|uniref:Release factor glutamine methyltransferase n=1 Tax=Fervidicella metallireducens AeB TaxID=1403537 RepID=A0A017RYQ4_9CLOT|nr:peptide chain release factor N(5)-glutamine methyltransferase [Fervidicella metallireducens]EYE89812.1 N5-glutamine S-adenosyl-L-methionine-dependent methyltransferase [Fervidicella metallireducens AeB]
MKIFEAIKEAVNILKDTETPQLDAEVLLCFLLKRERIYLYLNRIEELDVDIVDKYFKLVDRRKRGEPTQYITGHQEFMSLDFYVEPGVLIPRGDTEILVEEVLKKIESLKKPVVADVGCGSGAISVSIAKYKDDAVVYALDVMPIPLEITKINAEINGVNDRVIVLKSDKLAALEEKIEEIDVIVSNPPYIREDVIKTLMTEVRDYEPYTALSGGEDGLYFYRKITKQAARLLKNGGLLAYEIGHDQREDVTSILVENGFENIEFFKDYAGHDRVVLGWKK